MKKLFIATIIVLIYLINTFSYAYTKEFSLMIKIMDIPEENTNGKELNEDLYNAYSLFVYGSPMDGYAGQRWKYVDDGKWIEGAKDLNASGKRGEYWILGENDIGKQVHNHKFPVDIEPPTPPTAWRYAEISDAESSWQESEKYMDDIQKEYMLTQKLTRNDITYDITSLDIGLNKVRLENYATWKTKGSVYTERYDMNNKRWSANFMVPPMAGNAELEGFLNFDNNQTEFFLIDDEELIINLSFGANCLNLSEYALKEHVKEIKSELYVDNKLIDFKTDEEVLSISKDSMISYIKDTNESCRVLHVELVSYLLTKFKVDGPLVDVIECDIYIYFDGVEKSGEIIEEIEDKILSNNSRR